MIKYMDTIGDRHVEGNINGRKYFRVDCAITYSLRSAFETFQEHLGQDYFTDFLTNKQKQAEYTETFTDSNKRVFNKLLPKYIIKGTDAEVLDLTLTLEEGILRVIDTDLREVINQFMVPKYTQGYQLLFGSLGIFINALTMSKIKYYLSNEVIDETLSEDIIENFGNPELLNRNAYTYYFRTLNSVNGIKHIIPIGKIDISKPKALTERIMKIYEEDPFMKVYARHKRVVFNIESIIYKDGDRIITGKDLLENSIYKQAVSEMKFELEELNEKGILIWNDVNLIQSYLNELSWQMESASYINKDYKEFYKNFKVGDIILSSFLTASDALGIYEHYRTLDQDSLMMGYVKDIDIENDKIEIEFFGPLVKTRKSYGSKIFTSSDFIITHMKDLEFSPQDNRSLREIIMPARQYGFKKIIMNANEVMDYLYPVADIVIPNDIIEELLELEGEPDGK